MDLNKVMLIGNLTDAPEMRTIPSGQPVANFSIATNRRWKDSNTGSYKEDTQFHRIVAWGKLAEICSQYMSKGMKVYIEGRLTTRSWDDQKTGQKRYMTEIVAENAIMLSRSSNQGGGNYQQQGNQSQTQGTAPSNQNQASKQQDNVNIPPAEQIPTIDIDENQEEIKVEDIPF
jgi:single-strand DNA-binding protein